LSPHPAFLHSSGSAESGGGWSNYFSKLNSLHTGVNARFLEEKPDRPHIEKHVGQLKFHASE
jgi:hypothetical protein